jgi:RNA polymerase sigma factor (sigma-70 family)
MLVCRVPPTALAVWRAYSAPVLAGNSTALPGPELVEMDLDDSVLWARSRSGDADAFTALFRRHAKAMYNYCFRRIGDWSAAAEALSVVFLEAWRRREKELPPGMVLPWLYGIATNVLRNQSRSECRFRAALTRVPEALPEEFSEEADERLDDERRMKRALDVLAQLRRREQEVFVLCAWFGLSYEDAALALDIPVGTVRSRLSRARKRLRELGLVCGHEQRRTATAQEALNHD